MTVVILIGFFLLMAIGVPVAFALGLAGAAVYALQDPALLKLVPQRLFTGIDLFALLAVPFYILAGELMGSSGILERLLNLARLMVGRFRGGLLQVNVLASMVFGGINGSAVAEASAVGSMLIPVTAKEYKDPPLACAVTACAAVVGPIIPPSVPMIIYALIAQNVSVAALFAAGIVPGVLIGLGLMVIAYILARRRNLPAIDTRYTVARALTIVGHALMPLMLPVILVGGVLAGIFTPVESGVVAVLFALFVGFFVTRTLSLRETAEACLRCGVVSAVVFLMMGTANIVTWIVTTEQIPHAAAAMIRAISNEPWAFLLMVNLVLLVTGLFLDVVAAMIMFVPILLPVAVGFGIDPLHFGLVIVLNLVIGLVTPPVGICLFVVSGIGHVSVMQVFRASLPFLAWLVFVLFLVTYVPAVYLWVPRLLGY